MRDRSVGWDGGIAAYANNQHRRIVDAKEPLMLAHRGGRDRARHTLAAAIIRFAMISGTADPKFRSDLQALSKASPIAKVAASSNQTFWVGMIFIGTSRKYERERRSVSQSPRLEAVSVMAKPVPLMVSCLIKTEHLWTSALIMAT